MEASEKYLVLNNLVRYVSEISFYNEDIPYPVKGNLAGSPTLVYDPGFEGW